MARTLIRVQPARRGEPFEVRATIAHPMETGYRLGVDGKPIPRDILTGFSASFGGEEVVSADLYRAIAANPTISFFVVAEADGELRLSWEGDNGFAQTETVAVRLVG